MSASAEVRGLATRPRPGAIDRSPWRSALHAYLSIARVVRAHEEQSLAPVRERIAAALAGFDGEAALRSTEGPRQDEAVRALHAYEARLIAKGLSKPELRARRLNDRQLRTLRARAAWVLRRHRFERMLCRAMELERIEAEAERLLEQKRNRAAALAAAPVEDLADFSLKLEILFAEFFQNDAVLGPLVAGLLTDVRGLQRRDFG